MLVAGVAAAGWAVHRFATLLFVLILSALFAYVIAPLVRIAEQPVRLGGRPRRLPRGLAIALVYALLAGAVAGSAALLLPRATEQVGEMAARAPAYATAMLAWERGWSKYYDRLRMPPAIRRNIDRSVVEAATLAIDDGRAMLLSLVGVFANLPWLILIPVFAFFFLKDAAQLRRALLAALPERSQMAAHRLADDLNLTLAAFIRAQLIACLLVGTLCGIGFAVMGTPYSVLLGVLAGALEFIPLVGPLLLAVVASIVGALHAPILVVWTVVFLAVLRLAEDYVIYPRLMRRGVHLHPLAVIVSVLIGAELAGVAGMFLAIPCAAVAAVAYRHSLDWRSGEPPLSVARHGV